MDSALRPRDIQARIRAGETPEAVAEAAQTSVDKIMAFAAPVLAERQHIADRAQRSSVRRRTGDAGSAGGARTLGDSVEAFLRSVNVDPDTVEWDAWRREDGKWTLTGGFASTRRQGAAHFTYDAPGNYVTADNDDARWLLGESVEVAETAEARDDLRRARQRRLTAVEDELPLGVDAIELVSEAPPEDDRDRLGSEQPLEAFLTDEPPADETELRKEAADAAALDTGSADVPPDSEESPEPEASDEPVPAATEEPAAEPPPTRRPVKKSRGRASVPSWDEIMFGGGKSARVKRRGVVVPRSPASLPACRTS